MSIIVKAGKVGKKVLKRFLPEEKHHISYTRRIERVRTTKRLVAMTCRRRRTSSAAGH